MNALNINTLDSACLIIFFHKQDHHRYFEVVLGKALLVVSKTYTGIDTGFSARDKVD